jgi:uncharacterized protein
VTLLHALSAVLLLAPALQAQERDTLHHRRNTVAVRGTGTVQTPPDQLRLTVQIVTRSESASGAMQEAGKRTRAVLDLLKSYGVEDRDIRTSRVGVTPVYDYEKRIQPPPIVGYTGTNDFSVLFRQKQMEKVGEFVDRAVMAGAATFGGFVYESSRERELERDALARAADDARARAQALASQLGATLGAVASISELPVATPRIQRGAVMEMASSQAAAPVMSGELSITVTVDVIFELK